MERVWKPLFLVRPINKTLCSSGVWTPGTTCVWTTDVSDDRNTTNEAWSWDSTCMLWIATVTGLHYRIKFHQTTASPVGIPIPGSRTIFSIPNPGIGDALIPGFRDYEKRTKCPNFTWYLPEKYLFPEFCGTIPGSKAESEQTRPQHQVRD